MRLDLFVKNVPTLLVKVFEINTHNYYRAKHREVDTDSTSTAWWPTPSRRYTYDEPPLRRVRAAVRVPDAEQAGRVRHRLHRRRQEQPGAGPQGPAASARAHRHRRAGLHASSTRQNTAVKDATLWLAGHEYTAGQGRRDHRAVQHQPRPAADRPQPAATSPRLDHFEHTGRRLRARRPASTSTAKRCSRGSTAPVLDPARAVPQRHAGVAEAARGGEAARSPRPTTTASPRRKEVPDFKLFEDRESIHEFQRRPGSAPIAFTLTAKVQEPEQRARRSTLRGAQTFALNEIDRPTRSKTCTSQSRRRRLRRSSCSAGPARRRPTGRSLSRSSTATSASRSHATLQDRRRRPGRPRAAGRHRHRDRDRPGGTSHTWPLPHDRHTLPADAARQGRRR